MPAKEADDKKVVLDRWAKLINQLQPGAITGTFTTKEAEAFYAKWVEMVAGQLGFSGNPRAVALRRFLARLRKLRAIKLARLELRACNIGTDKETMEIVRKFFGALKLTAPTVGTFFTSPISPLPVVRLLAARLRDIRGVGRLPGPIGIRVSEGDGLGWRDRRAAKKGVTRGFLRTTVIARPTPTLARSGSHLGAVEQVFFAFTLTIEETSAFNYTALGDGRKRAKWPSGLAHRARVCGWLDPAEIFLYPRSISCRRPLDARHQGSTFRPAKRDILSATDGTGAVTASRFRQFVRIKGFGVCSFCNPLKAGANDLAKSVLGSWQY